MYNRVLTYSGSFTGSFVGDGSSLTGVSATAFNIDALGSLGGATIAKEILSLLVMQEQKRK